MKDEDKSTEQLLNELKQLRRRVAELDGTEAKPLCTEKAPGESEQKLRLLHENVSRGHQTSDENERMLNSILAASPVAIGLTKGREIQWVNDAWLRMFGFEDDRECVGRSARIVYPSQEEYDRVGALLYEGAATDAVAEAQADFSRKDGSVFHGLIRTKALNTSDPAEGEIAAISDISDRKQAQDFLRESEQRLELALWGADLGLYDWDVQSGKAVVNQRSAGDHRIFA